MMRRLFTAFALVAFQALNVTVAQSDHDVAPLGYIQICRERGVIGAVDHRSVLIPAGIGFVSVDRDERRATRFEVHTVVDVTIPPKPACVNAVAVADQNFTGHPIAPAHERLLSQLAIAGLDLEAWVITTFVPAPPPLHPQYVERHYTENPRQLLTWTPAEVLDNAPAGASVICLDWTYGYPKNGTDSCEHHGGMRLRTDTPKK